MDPERKERVSELLEQARAGALSAEGQRELAGEYEDLRAQLRIVENISGHRRKRLLEMVAIIQISARRQDASKEARM